MGFAVPTLYPIEVVRFALASSSFAILSPHSAIEQKYEKIEGCKQSLSSPIFVLSPSDPSLRTRTRGMSAREKSFWALHCDGLEEVKQSATCYLCEIEICLNHSRSRLCN